MNPVLVVTVGNKKSFQFFNYMYGDIIPMLTYFINLTNVQYDTDRTHVPNVMIFKELHFGDFISMTIYLSSKKSALMLDEASVILNGLWPTIVLCQHIYSIFLIIIFNE